MAKRLTGKTVAPHKGEDLMCGIASTTMAIADTD